MNSSTTQGDPTLLSLSKNGEKMDIDENQSDEIITNSGSILADSRQLIHCDEMDEPTHDKHSGVFSQYVESREDCNQWVYSNVGGTLSASLAKTLQRHPATFLATLTPDSPFYDSDSKAYIFDRNPYVFQNILDYYRTGQLHFPNYMCGPAIKEELTFWHIDENEISPCCWSHYQEYNEQVESLHTINDVFNSVDTFDTDTPTHGVCGRLQKWRRNLWFFLEDPRSSTSSQLYSALYLILVLLSVVSMVLDTHPYFRVPRRKYLPGYNSKKKKVPTATLR